MEEVEECPEGSGRNERREVKEMRRRRKSRNCVENRRIAISNGNVSTRNMRRRRDGAGTEVDSGDSGGGGQTKEYHRNGF